jgi:hypothetical protein
MPSEVNSQNVRTGAYARYSSNSQRDAPIDDQVRAAAPAWKPLEILVAACRCMMRHKGRFYSH